VKTAAKDARQYHRSKKFHVPEKGPWNGRDVKFVWQRHVLYQTAGIDLAKQLDVPSVLFVPATLVWEALQWEVKRPGWEGLVERTGEAPALQGADLVACGSGVVLEQAVRIGVDPAHAIVTPSGVDLELFQRRASSAPLRARLKLEDRFVVGWAGSFRRFHALEQAVEAVSRVPNAVLLLIGDGPELGRIRRLARERDVAVKCVGTVPHDEVPTYLGILDVALVLASSDKTFHYSPLKLAEYLAVGVPVIAPRVEQLAERLNDGVDSLMFEPGNVEELTRTLQYLADEPLERKRLSEAARETAERNHSWDESLAAIIEHLGV
jgi:glycosyltransferase involved in cell wall biosynthesis